MSFLCLVSCFKIFCVKLCRFDCRVFFSGELKVVFLMKSIILVLLLLIGVFRDSVECARCSVWCTVVDFISIFVVSSLMDGS